MGTYRNYMKLLESWPLDNSKPGRDLAQHIRDQLKLAFAKGDASEVNREQCDHYYMCLKRICSNHYGQIYTRTLASTATGLTRDQCNLMLSPEALQTLAEDQPGYLSRTVSRLFKNVVNKEADKNIRKYSEIANEIDNNEIVPLNEGHKPVMVNEVLHHLEPSPGQIFVDMTFGAGGHSKKLLESSSDIKIFALDRDPIAYERAQKLSEKYPGQVIPLLGKFSELPQLLCKHEMNISSIDGFLFDFGCSSMQLDIGERGFSFSKNGPLDMRMDGFRCPSELTAAEVLQHIREIDLVHILKVYGNERYAKKIARAIIDARYTLGSLKTTNELAQLVESVIHEKRFDQLGRQVHNATKTFQALRIFVNNELNEINYGIIIAGLYLKKNGRLVTISFHSLEDTIVKRHISGNITDDIANKESLKYSNCGKYFTLTEMQDINQTPWKMLHKHVIVPTPKEIKENPRSRTAKLRIISKVV